MEALEAHSKSITSTKPVHEGSGDVTDATGRVSGAVSGGVVVPESDPGHNLTLLDICIH